MARAYEQVPPSHPVGLSLAEWRLCARVARLYHHAEMTQEQIGDLLGLSRMKVSRLLQAGQRSGVIEVVVRGPDEPFSDLEQQLITTHGLRDVKVVSDLGENGGLGSALAAGAATWLAEQIEPGYVIGVGLGRTVAAMAEAFVVDQPVDCTFVAVEGVGASPRAGFASYNVTARLAEAAGASFEIISAPTFVADRVLRDGLIQEPTIAAALERARRADIVIQSVGTVTSSALLHVHGLLSAAHLGELRASGAVGDALGHYFDDVGAHVPYWTDDVHVGLTLDDLRKLPVSVLVAGGDEKYTAIRAALRGGYFNALVTDVSTARRLLEVTDVD